MPYISGAFVSSVQPFQRTAMSMSANADLSALTTTTTHAQLVLSLRQHLGPDKIRLVLASASPRRQEILNMMGLQGLFETIPSPLDESALQQSLASLPPLQYTERLAGEKARALAETMVADHASDSTSHTPVLILGSDTIVELNGKILEKPTDAADAKRMLQALSGRNHQVHTGVALYSIVKSDEKTLEVQLQASLVDTALVEFAELSDADIDAYVSSKEPMDKAGSYGIQGMGGQFVRRIEGDFFTVRYQRECNE